MELFVYWFLPPSCIVLLFSLRGLVVGLTVVVRSAEDFRITRQHREARIAELQTRVEPSILTPEEQARGWETRTSQEGIQYKVLPEKAVMRNLLGHEPPKRSPRRRPFLERHKGPYLTEEDITRWWEELKDHEF